MYSIAITNSVLEYYTYKELMGTCYYMNRDLYENDLRVMRTTVVRRNDASSVFYYLYLDQYHGRAHPTILPRARGGRSAMRVNIIIIIITV